MPEGGAVAWTGDGALPAALADEVIGRRSELHLLLRSVELRRPVLILGPPGVSKTTMLRALARHLSHGSDAFGWLTGDEQLSAQALVGTFDPSLVLRGGYRPEHFSAGPLVRAMRAGGVLYIEEVNRAPSGALNVLLTALSEGYIEVPRLETVHAEPGFLVVAAANPHDDAGTTRLSRGLMDRFLVLEVGYQPRDEEIQIVRRHTNERPGDGADTDRLVRFAVDLVRRTRDHPELRQGASVRAAIDLVSMLAWHPGVFRGDAGMLRTAVCATMVGRIRLRPTATRTPCDIVMELFHGLLGAEYGGSLDKLLIPAAEGRPVEPDQTDAASPALSEAGDSPVGAGGDTDEHVQRRDELPGLERPGGSGERGESRSVPMVSRDQPRPPGPGPDSSTDALGEPLARFDYVIRKASELVLEVNGTPVDWLPGADGRTLHSEPWRGNNSGELDVPATLDNLARAAGFPERGDVRVLVRAPERADYLILIDHSGSMVGHKLVLAAMVAGVLADLSATGRSRYGVIAFDDQLTHVKPFDEQRDVEEVIERILHLPRGKATDLSTALRTAVELTDDLPAASETILISDCMPTKGTTSFAGLAALARRIPSLHICYVEERQPAIQIFASGPRLNLYEWWARRWVGDDRVHPIADIDQAERLTDALSSDSASS
ncbi:MAG: AAA family ATPase [Pseudonocardia sp.]|nr:AAA family ATPase [Pseudonocardia sp.]